MKRTCRRSGFTLVELLVVISIIVILMAILYPVFQHVRENARETQCQANLHQLAVAIKLYRTDSGLYPPAPFYNTTIKRYQGGFSALFPDYVQDKNQLICPDDRQIDGMEAAAKDRVYSSYNGFVSAPDPADETTWAFKSDTFHPADNASGTMTGPTRYYNYYGYTQEGTDAYYFNSPSDNNVPYLTTAPSWLTNDGLHLRNYPRLFNRDAPDNTYVAHCACHRQHYSKTSDEIDIYVNLGGAAKRVNVKYMEQQSNGASRWVTQKD